MKDNKGRILWHTARKRRTEAIEAYCNLAVAQPSTSRAWRRAYDIGFTTVEVTLMEGWR